MLYPLELTHRAMTDNCLISKSVFLSDSLDQQNSLHGIYQPTHSKMFLKIEKLSSKKWKKNIKKIMFINVFSNHKKKKKKKKIVWDKPVSFWSIIINYFLDHATIKKNVDKIYWLSWTKKSLSALHSKYKFTTKQQCWKITKIRKNVFEH